MNEGFTVSAARELTNTSWLRRVYKDIKARCDEGLCTLWVQLEAAEVEHLQERGFKVALVQPEMNKWRIDW